MAPKKAEPAPAAVAAPPEEPKEDPKIALRKQIEVQEQDILHNKRLLEAFVDGEGHSLRDAKILELFKMSRDLNLAYERERNASSKFKYQVAQLQQEVLKKQNKLQLHKNNPEAEQKTNAEAPAQANPEAAPQGTDPAADQQNNEEKQETDQSGEQTEQPVAETKPEDVPPEEPWREKYEQVSLKLSEVQSAYTGVTMEVSKFRSALQREVGEHVPVAKCRTRSWRKVVNGKAEASRFLFSRTKCVS